MPVTPSSARTGATFQKIGVIGASPRIVARSSRWRGSRSAGRIVETSFSTVASDAGLLYPPQLLPPQRLSGVGMLRVCSVEVKKPVEPVPLIVQPGRVERASVSAARGAGKL